MNLQEEQLRLRSFHFIFFSPRLGLHRGTEVTVSSLSMRNVRASWIYAYGAIP